MLALLTSVLLTQVGCRLNESVKMEASPIELVTPDGTRFASLWPGHIEARARSNGKFDVNGLSRGLRYSGLADIETVHVASRLSFARGFETSSATPLHVVRIAGSNAVVRLAEREDVELLVTSAEVEVPCSELRLSIETTKAAALVDHGSAATGRPPQFLEAGEEVFDSARGKPAYRLRQPHSLERLESAGTWQHVRIVLDDGAAITGWIPPRVARSGLSVRFGRAGFSDRVEQPSPRDCANPLTILARHGEDALVPMGIIQATAFFDVKSRDAKWVTITIRELSLQLAPGWSTVVSADELERCSALSP